ncbi:MAG: formate/nitrite transporter family protein [Lactovum sp.]
MYSSEEILLMTIHKGEQKINLSLLQKALLGFIAGAMISLGFLFSVRVVGATVETLGPVANLIGAAVFPIGLIVILLAGGELVTSNMMVVSAAFYAKKIALKEVLLNWIQITFFNILGAIFVAYVFGYLSGLTSSGTFSEAVIQGADLKLSASPLQTFLQGIGCNWFVGISVWLCYGAKSAAGKTLLVWFNIMTFVGIGFQHSIANAFILPAAIFVKGASWLEFISNFSIVWLGNIVGATIFVSGIYFLVYKKEAVRK